MKRWIGGALLGATLAGAGAILYASQVQRRDVQIDRFTVEINRPGVPPGGMTVLHLSDFHFRAGGRIQARKIVREHGNCWRASATTSFALTGDLIHDMAGFPVVLALIESLRPQLGAFSCPGNHDYAEYSVWGMFGEDGQASGEIPAANGKPAPLGEVVRLAHKLADYARKVVRNELVRLPVAFNDVPAMNAELAASGVQPLINRALRVPAERRQPVGGGRRRPDRRPARPGRGPRRCARRSAADPAGPQPGHLAGPRVAQADLVLSGHTHGGQVRLPLIGAAHTQGTHLTRRHPAGWFRAARRACSSAAGWVRAFRCGLGCGRRWR